MSELTFECPSCGQPLQCEKAYCGHTIHCPKCCAELRIPFTFSGSAFSIPKAELLSTPPPAQGAEPAEPPAREIHCVCPVCQSELKVPATTHAGEPWPRAQLVRAGTPPPAPPAEPKAAPPAAAPGAEAPAQREEQIAAARESHPISAYPPVKPRLDYILHGGKAPPAEPGGEPAAGGEEWHSE